MTFSACSTAQGKATFLERVPLPDKYTSEVKDCEWDNDTTYKGLVNHVKRLQNCLAQYKEILKQIRKWEQDQVEATKKKKQELGIEE